MPPGERRLCRWQEVLRLRPLASPCRCTAVCCTSLEVAHLPTDGIMNEGQSEQRSVDKKSDRVQCVRDCTPAGLYGALHGAGARGILRAWPTQPLHLRHAGQSRAEQANFCCATVMSFPPTFISIVCMVNILALSSTLCTLHAIGAGATKGSNGSTRVTNPDRREGGGLNAHSLRHLSGPQHRDRVGRRSELGVDVHVSAAATRHEQPRLGVVRDGKIRPAC